MAQLKDTTINGSLTLPNGNIYLDNGNTICSTNSNGDNRSMVQLNASNQYVYGYGGYSNNEGRSYYDGNEVYIRSRGGVYVTDPDAGLSARAYGQNKVLWSGASVLPASQAVTFSENASAQPNGIVLVFSYYNGSEALDYSWHTFFIPKYLINAHEGSGHDLPLSRNAIDNFGTKYVYIHNTKVVGHANNEKSGTGSTGIKYDNSKWCLRYVIGV